MAPPLLEVRHLIKHFPMFEGLLFQRLANWVKAVDDINFAIQPTSTLGLAGESGCGKTTTARVILALEKKTAGNVLFEGTNVDRLKGPAFRSYRTSVQAVFQDPYSSLDPRMRVGDTVAEPLQLNKVGNRQAVRERVDELLMQVGLPHHIRDLYPHELSGGQRQRVAIARALSLKPKLIVLDEPVSALDVSIRAQIMNLLKDLQDSLKFSYLLIAHNLATVHYMSNRVAIMYLGKIVEIGASDELYSHPLHPYTQALFNAALPSHPKHKRIVDPLPGEVPSPVSPPPGCRFNPRCSHAKPICSQEEPLLREQSPDHAVACHL